MFVTEIPKRIPEKLRWSFRQQKNVLVLENKKMGLALEYGLVIKNRKPSHCQPRFVIDVPSAVVVVYTIVEKKLKIGILKQVERPVSGIFDELPRGFGENKNNDEFESPIEIAARELKEETGINLVPEKFEILGGPYNMDSAWLRYSNSKAGIYIVAVEVLEKEIGQKCELDFVDLKEIDFHCGISQMAMATFVVKYHNII